MTKSEPIAIKPLFILGNKNENFSIPIKMLADGDDYNKSTGVILIDAKSDIDAILSFLNEYKDSPETFRSYMKEIERLLLWCIHVAKVNISSLRSM